MGFRIVIAGKSQCPSFAECVLAADFLSKNLPDFCYERIEKAILDWETWLCHVNLKNKWHHVGSPIVWKETLMPGSKPSYIGGTTQFLDYCYSYYNFDSLYASDRYDGLVKNIAQYKDKVTEESRIQRDEEKRKAMWSTPPQKNFNVTISGVKNILSMHLISGFLELTLLDNALEKIYVYDENCSEEFMTLLEKECSFVESINPGKIVKYVDRIGLALASSDLLIILDHVPFDEGLSIGEWLDANKRIMDEMAQMINASGSRSMNILFPNVGPACYNATQLRNKLIARNQIIVSTADLGLEIKQVVAEATNLHARQMFCPPVWGFVGINHIIDISTTIQRYDTFEPYSRFEKVKKSSLKIGALRPELRTMEYLVYYDETLWKRVAEAKKKYPLGYPWINKAITVMDLVKQWLFRRDPLLITNIGLPCNGSFGLNFDGIFSQPARLVDGIWQPATDFLMPKDRIMSLKYLEQMAEYVMTLQNNDLPPIVPFLSCKCKPKSFMEKHEKDLF